MKILLILVLSLTLSSCIVFAGANYYDQATTEESEEFFSITLRGERSLHPASGSEWFFPKVSKQIYVIRLPKRLGKIDGTEIPTRKGSYSFVGTVILDEEYVDFDLQLDNPNRDDWAWNGKYSFIKNKNL